VLGLATVLRVLVVAAIPNFFGPGDPAVYFATAQGVVHHGVPRIDFVWHYLTQPSAIAHVEDYYEPAFAYLLAGPMALFGDSHRVAQMVVLAFGVLAPWLVFALARRFGFAAALVAATIVAVDPWAIYYSGVLMKESVVVVLVVASLEIARRALANEARPARSGVLLGLATVGASLFQYELLPALAGAIGIALLAHRRAALAPFVIAVLAGVAAYVGVSTLVLGVPLTAKLGFFLGHKLWTPEIVAATHYGSMLPRFVPIDYMVWRILLNGYPVLVTLGLVGMRDPRVARSERTLLAAFGLLYLYVHGVPHDLWARDFLPLTAAIAPLAALAICGRSLWRTDSRLAMAGLAMVPAAWMGPRFALRLHQYPNNWPWSPWPAIGATLLIGLLFYVLLWRRRVELARFGAMAAVTPLLAIATLAGFTGELSWASLYTNPQFPNYEVERASREAACEEVRTRVPPGAIMTSAPWEVALYSGRPAVLLPKTLHVETIEAMRRRYGVRYLLVRDGEEGPDFFRALGVQPTLRTAGHTLFAFPEAAMAATSTHSAEGPSPAPR
jgi:Dolichyl-phosphate-mannose-protein mannosyltransferase